MARPEDKPSAQVRERLPFSVNPALWKDATVAARQLGGTVSLLVEALTRADLLSPTQDFTIYVHKRRP
jgi:hypothetical protein